ncbi:MAG: hypothetical protein HYY04_13355, partial [Chloroflexi bacterium]|nr:hypothetical protein [Chloroflexota bacterium]
QALAAKLDPFLALTERRSRLERVIAEARHALDAERQLVASRVASLRQEAGRLPLLERELRAVQEELGRLASVEGERDGHLQAVQRLTQQAEELRRTDERLRAEQQRLAPQRDRIPGQRKLIAEIEVVVAQREAIQRGMAELETVRRAEQALAAKLDPFLALTERRSHLERLIAEARHVLDAERQLVASRVIALRQEVGRLPLLERELAQLREELGRLATVEAERDGHLQAIPRFTHQAEELRRTNERLRAEATEYNQRLKLVDRAGATCPICETPLDDDGHDRLHNRFKGEIDERHAEFRRNEATTHECEQQAEQAKRRLAECDRLLRRKGDLDRRFAALGPQVETVHAARTQLADAERELAAIEAQLREGQYAEAAQLAVVEQDLAGLGYDRDEHERLRRRREELAPVEQRQRELATAEQRLPEERERLAELERAAVEIVRLDEELRQNEAKARESERQAGLARQQIAECDRLLRRKAELERRLAALTQEAEKVHAAQVELAPAERELAAIEARLREGQYAEAPRAELAVVEQDLAGLGYDRDEHERLRRRREELAPVEQRQRELATAEQRLPEEQGRLAELERATTERERELAEDRHLAAMLLAELAEREEVLRELALVEDELNDLGSQLAAARTELGRWRQMVDTCRYYRAERARREAERVRLASDRSVYEELAVAFGKKGIQAMIIESVIPEIEVETSAVLARMTDNRMHVTFETQREARSDGHVIETLDIKIADELGTRALELYSGGEAFRVNFAIRVALSKLLARRAGARLQLLVVDEGFGTQDAFGRQRLVEAINAVRDDFEKILVITHIEELKDAFPIRIDVVKGPEGSRITIN